LLSAAALVILQSAIFNLQSAMSAESADEAQRLLAEKDRRRSPTFPGKDPAFLILPRPLERSESARELLTPQVREMTEKALAYLARTQDAEGGWSDSQYPSNTGVTALASLAFMSEGSQPRAGRFGKSIDRGMEFLLKNVQSGGAIAGKGSNPLGPMYEHSFSTLALLYAAGDMPWRSNTRDVIARAIQTTARSQLLREGQADMSVTANVLWVLRAAKKSGFTVSAEAINKGVEYIEKCAMPDGNFRYRYWGLQAEPSLGGLGIIALANQGKLDHQLIPAARERIAYQYRRLTISDLKSQRYFVYGTFYASLAMYVSGDEYWIPWHKKAVQVLADMQRKDGEFADEAGNTIYPTAMALMVLQAPLGYLPIYER
jgi:Prenyltransferase and squalene oxidase repeat